jgi:hypothetical protein
MTISTIAVYDLNAFLKADATITSIAGKTLNFFPVVATDSEPAPFVVYFYNPMIPDVEAYWMRYDAVKYSIFDTNADRLFRLSERFVEILGHGDQIQTSGGVNGTDTRIFSCYQTGSNLIAPLEINGWYRMNLDFKLCYVSE